MFKRRFRTAGLSVFFAVIFFASPAFAQEDPLWVIYNTVYGGSYVTSNADLESTYGVAGDEVFLETNGYVEASARFAGYTQRFGYYTDLCVGSNMVELFNVTTTGYLSGYTATFLVGGGTTVIGFYTDPSGSPTWFSQPVLNSDGQDHMRTFRAPDYDPLNPEYLIAWEDLENLGDGDYNDLVLVIRYLEPYEVTCCDDDADCNDSDNCTIHSCVDNVCVYTPKDCSHLDDQCIIGVCDPVTGDCVEDLTSKNGLACDDGDACTEGDTCSNGICGGTAKDCSALDDQCNVGVCDPVSGECVQDPAPKNGLPCDDGLFCNGTEVCNLGVCETQPETEPCQLPYLCDEDNDQCVLADVIVEPGDVWYNPNGAGDVTVKKPVCLDNPEVLVGGLQFDLCEYNADEEQIDCMECIACELSERTTMFDCAVLELPNGCCRVLMYCKNPGCAINPGVCNIATVVYKTFPTSPECPWEECITQVPENIIASDYNGYQLTAAGLAGTVCPFFCGDVCPPDNPLVSGWDCGDGVVDIYDIMCEVDFALTSGTPDDCQAVRADVPTGTPPNCIAPDGKIDILDVMVIIDMALNRQDCCSFYYQGSIY